MDIKHLVVFFCALSGFEALAQSGLDYRDHVDERQAVGSERGGGGIAGALRGGNSESGNVIRGTDRYYPTNRIDEANTEPYFTIPDTSLLANSTATTALAGKVYLNSDIVYPRLFKVRVGRDNLTSNGVRLPAEIEGMVLEGYAVGEYITSCVRGILTAGTFVFEDGTVRSMYPGDAGSRDGLDRIGYISDRWGNDCIPGELITDAGRYLGSSFALAGLVGYAEALRAAQTDTVRTTAPDGSVRETNNITGNPDRYAAAAAVAGGIDATVEWLDERHQATTDLVYLPAGQKIDVHIQQELRIDIPSNARKVRYKRTSHVTDKLD